MLDAGEVLYQSLSNIGRMYSAGVQDQIDRKRKLEDVEAARAFERERDAQRVKDQKDLAKYQADLAISNIGKMKEAETRALATVAGMPNADTASFAEVRKFTQEKAKEDTMFAQQVNDDAKLAAEEKNKDRRKALEDSKYADETTRALARKKAADEQERDFKKPAIEANASSVRNLMQRLDEETSKLEQSLGEVTPAALQEKKFQEKLKDLEKTYAKNPKALERETNKLREALNNPMAAPMAGLYSYEQLEKMSKTLQTPILAKLSQLRNQQELARQSTLMLMKQSGDLGIVPAEPFIPSSSGMFGGGNTPPPPPVSQATTAPKNPEAGTTLPGVTNPGSGTALPDAGQKDTPKAETRSLFSMAEGTPFIDAARSADSYASDMATKQQLNAIDAEIKATSDEIASTKNFLSRLENSQKPIQGWGGATVYANPYASALGGTPADSGLGLQRYQGEVLPRIIQDYKKGQADIENKARRIRELEVQKARLTGGFLGR